MENDQKLFYDIPLINYHDRGSKEEFFRVNEFEYQYIKDSSLLKEKIDMLKSEDKYIFRGLSDNLYKNYPSLFFSPQCNKSLTEFRNQYLRRIFSRFQEPETRKVLEKAKELGINHIAAFCQYNIGFLQHFDRGTPFLDFSYDVEVALAFSASKKENKNLVSLYYLEISALSKIESTYSCLDEASLLQAFKSLQEVWDFDSYLSLLKNGEYKDSSSCEEEILKYLDFNSIDVKYIDYPKDFCLNNIRIERQKGCFLSFNYSASVSSLEDFGKDASFQKGVPLKLHCIDFHASHYTPKYTMEYLGL